MTTITNFTDGKILKPLFQFAIPVLLAMLLQVMYGAVDLLIVGQFGQAKDVCAVATGSQVLMMVTSIISGFAMGITILIGQKIGEDRLEEAGDVVGSGICIFSILAIILSISLLLFATLIATFMRTPSSAFTNTVLYIRICGGGTIFLTFYNMLCSVFRGLGDSKTPLLTILIACISNISGDYLLVGIFHLGVTGAAIATVFAQGFSVLMAFFVLRKKGLPFLFTFHSIRFHKKHIRQILAYGFPIALQDGLVHFSFLAITMIVNSLGVIASAGVGVAEKLAGFILLVPSSFAQSVAAFSAQNFGAKKGDRAQKALIYGITSSLTFGVFIAYFSFFHGNLMAGLFSTDSAVIQASWDYMKAYSIDCLLTSFMFCFTGYFNGYGKTTFVMIQGILGAFCVRIPLSYLMSQLFPKSLFFIGLATPASTLLQVVLCFLYFHHLKKQKKTQ